MALTKAGLSAAILAKLTAGQTVTDTAALQKFCDDIADAIVTYVKANAVVMPTALLSAAPGAPVTGTGTIL
jgi:hypothetical protein